MNFAFSTAMAVLCMDMSVTVFPTVEIYAAAPVNAQTELVLAAAGDIRGDAKAVDFIEADTSDSGAVTKITVKPVAEMRVAQAPDGAAAEPAIDAAPSTLTDPEPLVFEGETDEALVDRLTAYLEDLDTLNGDFRQVAPSGAISTGRFFLRRPGLLRFEYDAPSPLLIVANGGLVYVRDEALETTDSYPVGKTPLKFLLKKKVELGDAKIVAVDRGIDTFAVTFASDADETEGELTIIASAPEISLTRWIVRDLQNGITEVTLSNVETGKRLANRLFRAPEAGGDFLKN